MGGPHPTLGVDSEGSAVFRNTVFEAFRRLAPFSLPSDHSASHDDVGEAIVVHARDAAGVVKDALDHCGCMDDGGSTAGVEGCHHKSST